MCVCIFQRSCMSTAHGQTSSKQLYNCQGEPGIVSFRTIIQNLVQYLQKPTYDRKKSPRLFWPKKKKNTYINKLSFPGFSNVHAYIDTKF